MIGAAPVGALFFDGFTAQRQPVLVTVTRDGRGLSIDKATRGGTPMVWPLDRLRALADQSDKDRLTLTLFSETEDETPRDPARLVLKDAGLISYLRASAPSLDKRDNRRGTAGRIMSRLALAAGAIALILFVILPRMADFMAERMTLETEVRFGKSVMGQMERLLNNGGKGDLSCRNPKGVAALDAMLDRLTAGQGLKYDLELTVFNHSMVNAFAAPGGQMVIIRGLLDEAKTAEEVAGVLAHEIGHVEARDPTRLTLRAAGSAGILSVILGDVSGGTLIGLVGDHLLRSAYTRDAEAAADAFGLKLLNDAGVSSEGLADFFQRIGKDDDLPEYLSSHPSSTGRADVARNNARDQANTTPILTDAQWADLRAICGKTRPVDKT